ncbi:hypothetical protein [Fodinicurvata fenggangensis]|uniref:hypothetical protein n=1 Tax=Fodinicurvata fenggangensis TaxID=1121830 RepID=UPI0012DCB2F7|nr:hypothetical protein [Fodinicurvata fenggangensis]
MSVDTIIQSGLFSSDFLKEAVTRLPDWQAVTENEVIAFRDLCLACINALAAGQPDADIDL